MTDGPGSCLTIGFCGEEYTVGPGGSFSIGREADLVVDDNPYLHRRFLQIDEAAGMFWLRNVGGQLAATVADGDGLMQAWLSPGASLPVVFPRTLLWFTAGPTTYEIELDLAAPAFAASPVEAPEAGATTIGRTRFTPDQRLLMVALAEPVLRLRGRGTSSVPSSAHAAARLGWTITKFNRKLDNVCDKLDRLGVRGLRGDVEQLATNRRTRLVEYAVASRLVTEDDLALLERGRSTS